jgi:hypothetical protein
MTQQNNEEFVYFSLGSEIQSSSIIIDSQRWEGWIYSSLPESPFSYTQALAAEAKKAAVIDLVKRIWRDFHERDIRLWSHFGIDVIAIPRLPVLEILKYERTGERNAAFQNNSFETFFNQILNIFNTSPFEILFADSAGLEAIFLNPVDRSCAEYFQEIIYSISIDSVDLMFHELYRDEIIEDSDARTSTIVIDYILHKQTLRLYWS